MKVSFYDSFLIIPRQIDKKVNYVIKNRFELHVIVKNTQNLMT